MRDPGDSDNKYVTFKREDLIQLVGMWTAQDLRRREAPSVLRELELLEVPDAVVMRRQDYFASPAFATYASMIGVACVALDGPLKDDLLDVADYFQRQSELAAAEAWKFPTI